MTHRKRCIRAATGGGSDRGRTGSTGRAGLRTGQLRRRLLRAGGAH